MKRLLKEPLLHFLLLGASLFVAYSMISRPGGSAEPGKIVITRGQLASVNEGFLRTRQRAPTGEEWEGLVQARVREEVYYREALALGLDKDDSVIRRRLQQKLEFVSDDTSAEAPPSEAELSAYLLAHADKFRLEPTFTFRQLYLDPERHGGNLPRDAARLLAKLGEAGGNAGPAAEGDPFMLEGSFTALTAGEVAKRLGEQFAAKLVTLQPGRWQGPVESVYGLHLVFVSKRTEARAPTLADVRGAVRLEWDNSRRLEAKEKSYREMLKRYTVTVEEPAPVDETVAATRSR
jgi:hypothetical protein